MIIKNIIFLLQEHNSIDQITPLVEILYQVNYNITLIKTVHNYDYTNDNNIKYIKQNYPDIIIKDLFMNENKLYSYLHNLHNYFNRMYSLQKLYPLKLINYILKGVSRRLLFKIAKLNELILNKWLNTSTENNTILVTEITNGDYNYELFLKKANELKIVNISFTHGFDVLTNYLLSYNTLEISNNTLNNNATQYADKMVVFNSLAVERIGIKHKHKLIQFPSLRFSSYWIDKIQDRSERLKFTNGDTYKLKIVFMLSAVSYNVWIDEQFRTIQSILLNKDIYLTIKVHPRDITVKNTFSKIKNKNFKVIGNEISSSALIDWSDIVITIGSGIIIEAIIKNKIVFYMKYLHCNKIEVENTKNIIHQVETRDEFVLLLNKYKNSLQNNFLDNHEKVFFLKDYILNDDFNENKQKYLDLFESV